MACGAVPIAATATEAISSCPSASASAFFSAASRYSSFVSPQGSIRATWMTFLRWVSSPGPVIHACPRLKGGSSSGGIASTSSPAAKLAGSPARCAFVRNRRGVRGVARTSRPAPAEDPAGSGIPLDDRCGLARPNAAHGAVVDDALRPAHRLPDASGRTSCTPARSPTIPNSYASAVSICQPKRSSIARKIST